MECALAPISDDVVLEQTHSVCDQEMDTYELTNKENGVLKLSSEGDIINNQI